MINLSDNIVQTVEGFDHNHKLETLLLKRNHIGVNGISDLEYLPNLKNVP